MGLKERFNFKKNPIYVIDGSSYMYKAFYAYPNLTRSDGFPTNAIFILTRILLKILKEERPKYACFLLDGKKPSFRQEVYKEYKSKRLKMPEPLIKQVPFIIEGAKLLGYPVYVADGVEADDCIASICERFKREVPVVIVGIDKDLQQCLDNNVIIWDPSGQKETIITKDSFVETHGLFPYQWPHFQALIGDQTDDIPGIPGIGPKTALKILKNFPTIPQIIENIDKLPQRERKKILPYIDKLPTYLKLTTLKTDSPPWNSLKEFEVKSIDRDKLKNFFEKFEFISLLREMNFSEERSGSFVSINVKEVTKTSVDKIKEIFERKILDKVGFVVYEDLCYIGIEKEEFCFSKNELQENFLELIKAANVIFIPSFKELISEFSFFEKVPLIKVFDISLGSYLLNPEERDYSWNRIFRSYIKEINVHIENHGLAALKIGELLLNKVNSSGLKSLMEDIELPLIPVLVHMEKRGVAIDLDEFKKFLKEVENRLAELTQRIYSHAKEKFNIRSNQQLADILFNKLKLKPIKKTPKGQPSTDSSVLEMLKEEHPIVKDILEFRYLEKLRSTYLKPLPKMVGEDKRLHTTFNNLGTATGRLSSKNPNLQNIPIRGELGPRMRSCFVAEDGNLLISADYSQIELRILAHLSQDPYLLESFRNNEDIHSNTASILFDKPKNEITPDERRKAKTINFGLLYGMGPQKLAKELGIKMSEAKKFIEKYFSKLKKVKEFYERVEEYAKDKGYVTTLSGRRRFLPDIHSRNLNLMQQAKRMAINTVVQGSAADIIKIAMIRVENDEELIKMGAKLILQVHDELLLEAPEKNAEKIAKRVSQIMSKVIDLSVPLVVDWGIGRNWAEAH